MIHLFANKEIYVDNFFKPNFGIAAYLLILLLGQGGGVGVSAPCQKRRAL